MHTRSKAVNRTQLEKVFRSTEVMEKLDRILNDFYSRLSEDPMLGFFFSGKDIVKIAEKQRDFILKASGIKSHYNGKTPTTAHFELPKIRAGHFNRRTTILRETLESYSLSPSMIKTWLDFENAFKNVIVSED